jgi:hypothetical protein
VREVRTIVNMAEVGGGAILSGAASGRNALASLLTATAVEPALPTPVFLNFAWVDVATASFLRESILTFRDFVRGRRSNFYPVVANPNADVRDEFEELVCIRGDVLMACMLDDSGNVIDATPIGQLEPKQQLTFDLVRRHGETDAGELMRKYAKSEKVHTTAWNNRLAGLAARGLVIEVSQGRAKRYKALFEKV